MLICPLANAQDRLNIDFFTRVEYNYVSGTDGTGGETSGFRGRHIFLRGSGDLGNGFTYSIAHRLNNVNSQPKYFDSTDWSWLRYTTPNGNWAFTAGKIVLETGSFEWDANPIYVSVFTPSFNFVNPYQIGVSVARNLGDSDCFSFICTRSMYDTEFDNSLSYSLEWRATHGLWQSLYVAQFIEEPAYGGFLQLGLGNIFTFGPVDLNIDLMTRTSPYYSSSWRYLDATLSMKLEYNVTDRLTLFAKGSYERNDNETLFDPMVPSGTATGLVALGVDYYPLASRNIKLFAFAVHSDGYFGELLNRYDRACFGLFWKIRMISL